MTPGGLRSGDFSFGLTLPEDFDNEGPSQPTELAIDELDVGIALVSWTPSTDEGVGVRGYEYFIDGHSWGETTEPTVRVRGLSPLSSYELTIVATDNKGNASEASAPLAIETPARAQATAPMELGTGIFSTTNDVWRSGVNFAAERANYENSNPFNPEFLEEISHYRAIRLMDWWPTNNNWMVEWSERKLPDNPDQTPNPN